MCGAKSGDEMFCTWSQCPCLSWQQSLISQCTPWHQLVKFPPSFNHQCDYCIAIILRMVSVHSLAKEVASGSTGQITLRHPHLIIINAMILRVIVMVCLYWVSRTYINTCLGQIEKRKKVKNQTSSAGDKRVNEGNMRLRHAGLESESEREKLSLIETCVMVADWSIVLHYHQIVQIWPACFPVRPIWLTKAHFVEQCAPRGGSCKLHRRPHNIALSVLPMFM